MASPNSEQLKAIEHQGGVLLKAGAGSGKTFVLKEHLIYLAKGWIQEAKEKGSTLDEFEIDLKKKFRKIVMMTFTKKAAGELSIRLEKEFKAMPIVDEPNEEYWKRVDENLGYLTVSTIHGFCFKIIKMGIFPGISGEQDILTESEFQDRLFDIFDENLLLMQSDENQEIVDLILKDKMNVFNSIKSIFSDPTLRNLWGNLSPERDPAELDNTIGNLLSELGFDSVFTPELHAIHYGEFKGKKWYDFMVEFQETMKGFTPCFSDLVRIINFFEQRAFKIPAKPSVKTVDIKIVTQYEAIKDFKDFLKKNADHFIKYQEGIDGRVQDWFLFILELTKKIEVDYQKVDGVTFSDLEYIVYKSLEDPRVAAMVAAEFDYFIVDEFQDTSFIQFAIFEKIIQSNYKKLFCVGDLKQAIYGFRGGELGVFLNCEKNIPQNLSLKNNYRSDVDIINFNNVFFDFIFKRGAKYVGVDHHCVEVEYQAAPPGKEEFGEVKRLVVNTDFIDTEDKINNLTTDYLEALGIFREIKNLSNTDEGIAVLYKRLKPSLILINLLMEADIGFSAQIKVPFLEDPIIGLFNTFIEREFNGSEQKDEYELLLIRGYLNILGMKNAKEISADVINNFEVQRQYFGLYQSFANTLDAFGLKNSNYKHNLEHIKVLIKSASNINQVLIKSLKEQQNVSYSLEFHYGENAERVKLMTAHASKGLQFPHVFLGGIYTNENSIQFTPLIGKLPYSFKWMDSIYGKDKYKTPFYMYEEQLSKKKDFSESKRLFYVASTRAEKTINWVHINWGELKRSKVQSNSWMAALLAYDSKGVSQELVKDHELDISKLFKDEFLEKFGNTPPLFHIDSLGINFTQSPLPKVYLSELAVTKMATIEECPRKFYFQNICKFSKEEMDLIENPEIVFSVESEDELSSSNILKSSASRGSEIHEKISELIISEMDSEILQNLSVGKKAILWTVDKLKPYLDNYNLISEKPIKFEIFNYMVSGIPDLVMLPNDDDQAFEIWDYKTGKYSESKTKPYLFQLMAYAYAMYKLKGFSATRPCRLVLCFVDEQKIVEKNVFLEDVNNYLTKSLGKVSKPDIRNEEFCEYCDYKIICSN
jgi:ATP-dependent exoDNAse (exonuclease V) beta subunit